MKDINIGINIQLKEETQSVWTNGIIQNAINLVQHLQLSSNNYNVFLVNIENEKKIPITDKLSWDLNIFNTFQYNEIKDNLDILIILGSQISSEQSKYLKSKGTKLVYYDCGNLYIIDMENILFKDGKGSIKNDYDFDEVWMIPQMENTNYYYLETIYRKPIRVVPFLWSSYHIDRISKQLVDNGKYKPKSEPKRISCFEPNINVFKYCMYDVLIAEKAYNLRPELFKHLYVTNSLHLKEKEKFVSIMNSLNIVKNKLTTFEGRFIAPHFLSTYTDVVVAHQWENALNYAYLDALYLDYPLVHNAHLCKDAGYYYDEFNVDKGAKQLIYAIENHDNNLEEYKERNKKVLDRYSVFNENSLKVYDELIDNLFKKNKKIKNRYYNIYSDNNKLLEDKYNNKDINILLENRFTKVYKENLWGDNESKSGRGSSIEATKIIRDALPNLFKKYNIRRIIDSPCGDFNWMKEIVNNLDFYKGIDIVKDIVDSNNEKYSSDKIKFEQGNIVENFDYKNDNIDLIICRDVLVHLYYDDIKKVLENFKNSGIKYLLMTHYIDCDYNRDFKKGTEKLVAGMWRPLNFTLEPFNMLEPICTINELENYNYFDINIGKMTVRNGKTLSLWKIN